MYVRGANGEDLTHLISKVGLQAVAEVLAVNLQEYDVNLALQVVFQLHPSFDNPTREYTHPPYEVTETGWGEFEIVVIVSRSPASGTFASTA